MLLTHLEETLKDRDFFVAIHPLDDAPEAKREVSHLGRMRMTPRVRRSLIALRAYLIAMVAMLLYHVIGLAGILHK